MAHYQEAIRLKPDFAECRPDRAWPSSRWGLKEAVAHYEEAVRLKPDYVKRIIWAVPSRTKASWRKRCAVSGGPCLKPDYAEAHNNLAASRSKEVVLRWRKRSHYQEALRLKPDFAEAHYDLGNALQAQGDSAALAEAVAHYQEALHLKPDYAERTTIWALRSRPRSVDGSGDAVPRGHPPQTRLRRSAQQLGVTLEDQGQLAEAVMQYQEALRLKPDYAEAHNNLGNALREQGQLAEAVTHYQEALRLKPDYAEAHNNLGNALREQGQLAEAVAVSRGPPP